MESCRTFRFDLKELAEDVVLSWIKEHQEAFMEKVLLYKEVSDVEKKDHIQGWIKFKSKQGASNFQKNILRLFKKSHELGITAASCATIKKASYFAYTAKDKQCVYSHNVTEEERKYQEDKSYKKEKKETIIDMVYQEVFMAAPHQQTKVAIAEKVIELYIDTKKPINLTYVKAQALVIWGMIHGKEVAARRLAREIFFD